MADQYIPYSSRAGNSTSSGTVTSVGLADSTGTFNITGSPVTGSGTLTLASFASQTQNKVLASPNGSSGAPTFRALVAADVPVAGSVAWGTITGTLSSQSDLNTALGLKAPLANPTFTGSVLFGNYHIEPSEANAGNSGTALTVDLSTGAAQKITLTGSVTLTLTNPQTGGAYVFKIIQGASSYTVTWPVAVKWPGGTAPVITTTNGRVDLINLYYDGTDYFGSFSQNYTP